MESASAPVRLEGGLKEYFNSPAFSDLTVQCQHKTFCAHRIVLASQSGYFAKACNGPWREAETRVIPLEGEDCSVIEAVLSFFYKSNYEDNFESEAPCRSMLFNVCVYAAADKYVIPQLKALSRKKFQAAAIPCWNSDCFSEAVATVYSTTPASDGGLRSVVVEISRDHVGQLVKREEFVAVLKTAPEFAVDLLASVAEHVEVGISCCPFCHKVFEEAVALPAEGFCRCAEIWSG